MLELPADARFLKGEVWEDEKATQGKRSRELLIWCLAFPLLQTESFAYRTSHQKMHCRKMMAAYEGTHSNLIDFAFDGINFLFFSNSRTCPLTRIATSRWLACLITRIATGASLPIRIAPIRSRATNTITTPTDIYCAKRSTTFTMAIIIASSTAARAETETLAKWPAAMSVVNRAM